MPIDNLFSIVNELVESQNYEKALKIINNIKDKERRVKLCYELLICEGLSRAIGEYGEVYILKDKDKYERAKMGMEDLPPHAVIYGDENGMAHGLDNFLDFIPKDNPLKEYYFNNK